MCHSLLDIQYSALYELGKVEASNWTGTAILGIRAVLFVCFRVSCLCCLVLCGVASLYLI